MRDAQEKVWGKEFPQTPIFFLSVGNGPDRQRSKLEEKRRGFGGIHSPDLIFR